MTPTITLCSLLHRNSTVATVTNHNVNVGYADGLKTILVKGSLDPKGVKTPPAESHRSNPRIPTLLLKARTTTPACRTRETLSDEPSLVPFPVITSPQNYDANKTLNTLDVTHRGVQQPDQKVLSLLTYSILTNWQNILFSAEVASFCSPSTAGPNVPCPHKNPADCKHLQ